MQKGTIWFRRGMLCFCLFFLFFWTEERTVAQSAADLTRKLEQLNAYPDLIVVNAKVATMDARLSQAEAMAVKNNRILAVGTNDQIRFLAGPKTEVLDAKGRRVLPGLIDGHTHPHVWAPEHWMGAGGNAAGDWAVKRYNQPEMRIVYTRGNDQSEVLRSLEQLVRQRAQELGPGKWIWVTAFAKNTVPESREIVEPLFRRAGGQPGTISKELLDTLAPNNPLLVFNSEIIGGDAHNTKAKEEMEKFLGVEVSGLQARVAVPYDILLRGRTNDIADMVMHELLTCFSAQAVTTFGNYYYNSPTIMKVYNLMYQRGDMPIRWGWWMGGGLGESKARDMDPSFAKAYPKFFYGDIGDFRGIGNDYIWNVGVSNEGWEGGLTCSTAKPPANLPTGTSLVDRIARDGIRRDCATAQIDYDEQAGYARVKAALESGLRIGFLHGYSDGTYDALFHMVEEAMSKGKLTLEQVRALRISTEHNPIMRPDQVQKMAKYNMMPAFNGYQVQGNIKGGAFLKAYGEQYMTWIAPMKSLVDAGAHPVFNTDAHLFNDPPEATPMDWPIPWKGNIWGFVEFFVTRRMPTDGITYNRAEAMDRGTLMKAATIWGAEQLLNEKNIGSLEVGKLADFIILDKDYFTIPEDQIHTIQTLLTAVGGKTVYKSPSY